MLRTSKTPLRFAWDAAHRIAIRGVARTLAAASNGTVYAKGSFGYGDPVYGVSDIDLVVVVPSAADGSHDQTVAHVRSRWSRLMHSLPGLRDLFHLFIYDSGSLQDALSAPCFTYGLARDPPRAAFLGPTPVADEMGLQERPELYGAPREWRRVAGPPIPLEAVSAGAGSPLLNAWLELQFWWRYVFPVCVDPSGPRLPYLAVKLVAEPARIWLWLTEGRQVFSRVEALKQAAQSLPAEADAFRDALALHARLPRSPEPQLETMLPHFLRLSSLIAAEIAQQSERHGATAVRLVGGRSDLVAVASGDVLPLVDWRARTVPPPPDEVFRVAETDPGDPAAIAAAANDARDGEYVALRHENVLVFPGVRAGGRSHGEDPEGGAARWHRVKLRGIQCRPTDPVSFALAEGQEIAAFPNVAGWSAPDSARRAVAEHQAWLAAGLRDGAVRGWVVAQAAGAPHSAVVLGRLFTAARAALFLESLSDAPELALTVRSVATSLREQQRNASISVDAVEAYAAWRGGGGAPKQKLVDAFAEVVSGLRAFRR